MPLFDFFKKSDNKKSSKNQDDDKLYGSPALQKSRLDAATELIEMLNTYFQASEENHPGTILATVGRLTGTSLYRSLGEVHDGKPGTVIESEKATEEWKELLQLFLENLKKAGIELDPNHFLRLETPEKHKSKKNLLQIQEALQDEYNAIMQKHGLDYKDGARAGIIACSRMFYHFCVKRKEIDKNLGANIIAGGFIGGSRIIPMPLKSEELNAETKNQPKAIDSAEKPARDNPFASPELNKKRYDAAMEFLQLFQDKTPLLNGRPHAGTVLSVGARLAGTSLYRSINKQEFDPGMVILSEEVNQAYPQLLNMFAYFCKEKGIDVMEKPLVQEIPEKDKPLMELAQIQAEYQNEYNEIMKKHGLDYLEGARAGMVVSSIFFNYHCINSKDIDPYVATGIVAMGVVEGAKTSPVPLNSKGVTEKSANEKMNNQIAGLLQTIASSSISGSGQRLIVGKGMAPMEEAQANGGKYLLANPGVLIKLEESKIDPFLIYETALHMELESKISRIDIVDTNVDELVQEWSGKPQNNAPSYVRQILWLKENAGKYGYQQSGNSWKLK